MKTKYSILDITNHIINNLNGDIIRKELLEYISYYAQCYFLAHQNKPLFDENFKIVKAQVIQTDIRDSYRNNNIKSAISYIKTTNNKTSFVKYDTDLIDDADKKIIDNIATHIIKTYKDDIVALKQHTYNNSFLKRYDKTVSATIPQIDMKAYFTEHKNELTW